MRKLIKLQKPRVLVDNAEKWTKEYCEALLSGKEVPKGIANAYNNSEIKDVLVEETHGKCAYCESDIRHVSYGDIEHILPKNKNARPDLYVEWTNLTLSCEVCNRSGKRTYYNTSMPLINPYVDEPDDYFQELGPMIFPKDGNARAYITCNILKLNRPELVEKRKERIENVEKLLWSWARESDPRIKAILTLQLMEEYEADREYSSTIRWFLIERGFSPKGDPQ